MARCKRLCIISTETLGEPIGEQNLGEPVGEQNMHAATETNGDQSSQHDQTNDVGETSENHVLQGPPKKIRGSTRKNDLWNMDTTKQIVVTFNKYGKPVGEEGNELTQFLGTLVRIAGNVGLDCCDWRKVPMSKKEDMYSIVKDKFVFVPAETFAIKKWILFNMGKKLNTWRNMVKSRNYDPTLSIDEIVARQSDKWVNPEHFRVKLEYQVVCDKTRKSRAQMEEPHVTGTKSFARLAHEEASLQAVASEPTNTRGLEDDWMNDDFSKVMGRRREDMFDV